MMLCSGIGQRAGTVGARSQESGQDERNCATVRCGPGADRVERGDAAIILSLENSGGSDPRRQPHDPVHTPPAPIAHARRNLPSGHDAPAASTAIAVAFDCLDHFRHQNHGRNSPPVSAGLGACAPGLSTPAGDLADRRDPGATSGSTRHEVLWDIAIIDFGG